MTKIDIFSGFLGAGKTTLIKKLITDAYKGEQLVLIENEFGEIGIDGGFLADAGIRIGQLDGRMSLLVQPRFRQRQQMLGTGIDAQPAALTKLFLKC